MSGKTTTVGSLVIGIALTCAGGQATAQDGEIPDADFLEFLGSWEEGDQGWLEIALEMAEAEAMGDTGKPPVSAETDNENK
ncbi:MAG: hypothetical protein ACR2QR_08225 [Woeseiaceae bacterium]